MAQNIHLYVKCIQLTDGHRSNGIFWWSRILHCHFFLDFCQGNHSTSYAFAQQQQKCAIRVGKKWIYLLFSTALVGFRIFRYFLYWVQKIQRVDPNKYQQLINGFWPTLGWCASCSSPNPYAWSSCMWSIQSTYCMIWVLHIDEVPSTIYWPHSWTTRILLWSWDAVCHQQKKCGYNKQTTY
jgi:hypothetical protein